MLDNIENLYEALPVSGRASTLRCKLNLSLIESLNYLLNACDEVIPSPLFLKASETLNSLNPRLKFSGFLSVLHSDLLTAIEEENIKQINVIAEKLSLNNFTINNIEYINIGNLDDYYETVIKNLICHEIPVRVAASSVSSLEYERMKAACEEGLSIIERVCPDYFEEISCLFSEILVFKADEIKHGSSMNAFGLIYRNLNYGFEKITDTIDVFIHELAHHYLFLLNTDDQIVVNADDLHASPLRTDKRPLIGIYHAAFVLARVIDVLQKALDRGGIPTNEINHCLELLATHRKRFKMAMNMLDTHAQLTPLGRALINSASRIVEESYAASCRGAVMPRAVR